MGFQRHCAVVVSCIILGLLGHIGGAWVFFKTLEVAHIGERLLITVVVNQGLRSLMVIIWGVGLRSLVGRGNLVVVATIKRLPCLLVI